MPNHVTFCPYTIGEDAYDAISGRLREAGQPSAADWRKDRHGESKAGLF